MIAFLDSVLEIFVRIFALTFMMGFSVFGIVAIRALIMDVRDGKL